MLTVPVLVGPAAMPRADQLPTDIAALAERSALRLRHESFDTDAEALIATALGLARDAGRRPSGWARRAATAVAGGVAGEAALLIIALGHKWITGAPLADEIGNTATLGLVLAFALIGAIIGAVARTST